MGQFSLPRSHHLKSRTVLGRLFGEGQSFGVYPLRFVWLEVPCAPGQPPVQIAVSCPKRRWKRAVDRNRYKRRVREAYRLRRPWLGKRLPEGRCFALMILFTGKESPSPGKLDWAMRKGTERLVKTWSTPA